MVRRHVALAGAWLAVVVVGIAIFYHLRHQPLYFDAAGYVDSAEGIRAQGLFHDWPLADLRTYGYPLALAATLSAADLMRVTLPVAIFGLQWVLFVGGAWFATAALFRSRRTRLLAFVAVAANPLLVIYTAQALTEAPTLTCVLFSAGALGRATRARSSLATAAWLAAGAVTSGFALALRPGNLLVPLCYGFAALATLLWTQNRRRWLAVSASAVLLLVSLALPLAPQVMINWRNFGVLSVLPVTDLASLQSGLGIQSIRYATNVSACGDAALAFPSPFVGEMPADTSPGGVFRYYVLNWPDGPETAAMHVFSGLDPRPFLTYQVSYGTWYERILQAFTLALLGLACFGMIRAPWSWRRITPDVGFLGAVTLGSVAILATSRAELRFGVILVTSLSLLAAAGASRLRRPTARTGVVIGTTFVTALLVWCTLSDLVLATSTTWQTCR